MNGKIVDWGELAYRSILLRLKVAMNSSSSANEEKLSSKSVVEDARTLCSEYIDDRLIRSGLNLKHRKITPASNVCKIDDLLGSRINLSRKTEKQATLEAIQILTEKRHASGGCNLTVDDLSKVLLYIGEALEIRHTNVYTDVLQQLNVRSLGEVNLRRIFMNMAKEIFREGIDWAKIVSLFAFAGGLAVDCVLSGSSIHIPRIKIWSVEYIENELTDWIVEQGGWIGLFDNFTTQSESQSSKYFIWTLSALILLVALMLAAMLAINFRGL